MSYVVDVVSVPVPGSYEMVVEARDHLAHARDQRLSDTEAAQFEPASPQMAELHRRLTARYPCIIQDPEGPWSDGPLINNFGQRIATLGISYSRVEEVLPFVIQQATDMGFWVLDPQNEAAHLPSGAALRPKGSTKGMPGTKAWWQFWR